MLAATLLSLTLSLHQSPAAAGPDPTPFINDYLAEQWRSHKLTPAEKTSDREFLRQHIVPGLKELALFYEDFLTEADENGNYIFVPSYSPENAFIHPQTGKATGVVLGVTGPWGGGKSSILNLIQERVKKDHPDAVVVRFDPWLISGRNDLISGFINELLGTIKARIRRGMLKLRDKLEGSL